MAGILFHINDLAVVLERAYEVRIKICFRLHSRHCKKLVLSGRNAEEVKLPLLISQSHSVQIAFLAMLGGRDQHDFDALRSSLLFVHNRSGYATSRGADHEFERTSSMPEVNLAAWDVLHPDLDLSEVELLRQ